jgi:squalene cyclase
MDLKAKGYEDVDWIDPAQDMVQWRAAVNAVMNLPISQATGNVLTSQRLTAYKDGRCSMEILR